MKPAALYPILDAEMAAAHGHDLVAVAGEFARLGLGMQQLRAKTLADREFLALAERLTRVVPTLIINDRADIAMLAGAAGVHVGQDDLSPEAARRLGCRVVGVSTHTPEQLAAARRALPGPDYVALGPIFHTSSKRNPDAVVGVEGIVPGVVAIGGITLENCAAVWGAGADAVAVISALWRAERPAAVAEQFMLAFGRVSCQSTEQRHRE